MNLCTTVNNCQTGHIETDSFPTESERKLNRKHSTMNHRCSRNHRRPIGSRWLRLNFGNNRRMSVNAHTQYIRLSWVGLMRVCLHTSVSLCECARCSWCVCLKLKYFWTFFSFSFACARTQTHPLRSHSQREVFYYRSPRIVQRHLVCCSSLLLLLLSHKDNSISTEMNWSMACGSCPVVVDATSFFIVRFIIFFSAAAFIGLVSPFSRSVFTETDLCNSRAYSCTHTHS